MKNGLSRLSSEARVVVKELKIAIWKKTGVNLSEKTIGSALITEAVKNKEIMDKINGLADVKR